MKKFYLICTILIVLSMAMHAQNDVTTFLGIPVDGSKSEMIQKLKAKGFKYDKRLDRLQGEFNGMNSFIYIVTNNNKVCRIMVGSEMGFDEDDIKNQFNVLCQQFNNNKKYMSAFYGDQSIPIAEDISYEMTVNNKQYEATYYQTGNSVSEMANKVVWFKIDLFSDYTYHLMIYYDNEYNRANGEDL